MHQNPIRRRVTSILFVTIALVLAGCGSDVVELTTSSEALDEPTATTTSDALDESTTTSDLSPAELQRPTIDDVYRVCGTARFDGPLDGPLQGAPIDAEVRLVMDDFVGEGGESWFIDAESWSIASRDDETIVLHSAGPGGDHRDATLRRVDGVWQVAGWGTCHVRHEADGFPSVPWALVSSVDPGSTEIEVLVREECASHPPLQESEISAVVVPSANRVTIVVFGRQSPPPTEEFSDMSCGISDNPPELRLVIELDEPIGERSLHDGAARGRSLRS